MAGLAKICKMYGGMKVTVKGKTIHYVWDYARDKAVDKAEMTKEEWAASERAKYAQWTQPK